MQEAAQKFLYFFLRKEKLLQRSAVIGYLLQDSWMNACDENGIFI